MSKGMQLLKNEGRDLTGLAGKAELPDAMFREAEVAQAIERLAAGRCVLLVGSQGVGKTAVVHALAHALKAKRGPGRPRRLIELPAGQVMVGTRYLGEWETRASALFDDAHRMKAVLYCPDVWRLPTTGVSSNSPSNLLDVVRQRVAAGKLLMIGEVAPETLLEMRRVAGFVELFDIVRIEPLGEERIRRIVEERARSLELSLPPEGLERVRDLCTQFLAGGAGPAPALRLLERVHDYAREKRGVGEPEEIGPAFVEKVFSIYSGLPRFVVDTAGSLKVAELRAWFRERVMGQEAAVDAVVESIVLFKAAINDPDRPLGSFLFVGPTGVGKTELARALAVRLFGSEQRLLRFDMSEFSAYGSFKLLIGDPDAPAAPARLTDPLAQQPFQVILFDELEKGHVNVWDLLLQILEDGRLTDARGTTVSFRNAFVIATSNVGAREADRRTIGFGDDGTEGYGERLREGLESFFRLELLNRFQHIVPFHALRPEHVERIVRKEIERVLERRGIGARSLAVEVTDELIRRIAERGYDRRYGARALKREIHGRLVVPVATLLAERRLDPGSLIKVDVEPSRSAADAGRPERSSVRVLDTEQSLTHAREHAPVRDPAGKRRTRTSLLEGSAALRALIDAIAVDLDAGGRARSIAALEADCARPDFWSDTRAASGVLAELERLRTAGARLERLRARSEALREVLAPDAGRAALTRAADELVDLERAVGIARLELVTMGADGAHDVLLELVPIGASREGRDELFGLYDGWARWRGHAVRLLHEPLGDDESVLLAIEGQHAHGYLRAEAGVHRFRRERAAAGSVRVRVARWSGEPCAPGFESRTALKKSGQLGGRVRSRTVVAHPTRMVLQNDGTLERNRDVAVRCALSWAERPADSDVTVRRHDREPFLLKDFLSGRRLNRPACLRPDAFHELLSYRASLVEPVAGNAPE